MKLLKYCTDWKTIYIIWILSFILISKPLPYYDEYLLKQYEISWWKYNASYKYVFDIYRIIQKNWMQSLLLLLLFIVPKLLVMVGNNVSSFIFQLFGI